VRSAPRLIALATLVAGCSPALEDARPTVHPRLAERPIGTIAVMPVDLHIEARAEGDDPVERATPIATAALLDAVSRRGYRAIPLGWDGRFEARNERRRAASPEALASLADWLLEHDHREARGDVDEELAPIEALPRGAGDATLYLGGVGLLVEDKSQRVAIAEDVATALAVVIAVAATVVLVAALLSSKGGGGGLDGLARGIAQLPRVGSAGARLGRPTLFVPSSRSCAPRLGAMHDLPSLDGVDGERSPDGNFLELGATLVDNVTGELLWSSAQRMPIDPVDGYELRKAVGHLLDQLPSVARR
jgi:hypothetical protein